MALRKQPITKLYYSIGEVAKIFNVNTSLIRYYENEFPIINPHRNKKGNRMFTQNDLDNFHTIFHLIKEKGYTLDGAKQKMKEKQKENTPDQSVILSLMRMKRFLIELKQQL